MRVLVLYDSITGNTETIAGAILAEALVQGHHASLAKIDDTPAEAIVGYDLVFVGAACHDSDLAKPALRLLAAIPNSPSLKMVGFATHAAPGPEGGQRNVEFYQQWAAGCERTFRQASKDKGFELVGYFSCQGAPSPPIEDFVHREILPDEQDFAQYQQDARKHPTAEDLEQVRDFARAVLSAS